MVQWTERVVAAASATVPGIEVVAMVKKSPLFLVVLVGFVQAAVPSLEWRFDDPSKVLESSAGAKISTSGTVTPIVGPGAHDSAIRVPKGASLSVPHGLGAGAEGYSILLDLRMNRIRGFQNLFQTDTTNSSDGDLFVNANGYVGTAEAGYSTTTLQAKVWCRLVLVVNNGTEFSIYLDGRKISKGNPQPLKGRYTLQGRFLLSADDNGETDTVDYARVAVFGSALSDTAVANLGGLGVVKTEYVSAGPWLQSLLDTGITVMWESKSSVAGGVECALDNPGAATVWGARKPAVATAVDGGAYVQKVRLGGLLPGRKYRSRVVVDTFKSPEIVFTTAPASGGGSFRFGVWGDSHLPNPALAMFRYMTDSVGIDFAVSTGDISNSGNQPADLKSTFLDVSVKSLGSKVPFFVAAGNHDIDPGYGGGPLIRRYLDQPVVANSDPAGFAGSYVAMYGDAALVMIDWSRISADIPGWLETQLKSSRVAAAKYVFVFIHRAPYYERWQVAEDATEKANYPPLIEKYKVSASFSGHMHGYERGYKSNTYYCTNGGMSYLDVSEAVGTDYPFITVGGYEAKPANFGLVNEFVTVSVNKDSAVARMRSFDGSGRSTGILDSFVMKPRNTVTAVSGRTGRTAPMVVVEGNSLVVVGGMGDASEPGALTLYGPGGEVLRRVAGPGGDRMDLAGIPKGLHFCQWVSPGRRIGATVVVP